MLLLTRLNGPVFALNPDLIERADATPDTVITLVNGTRYIVSESLEDLAQLVREYRAETAAAAFRAPMERHAIGVPTASGGVSGRGRETSRGTTPEPSHATVVELRRGDL